MSKTDGMDVATAITWLKHRWYRLQTALLDLILAVVGGRRPLLFVGPDSTSQLCAAIAQAGLQRVLIVTDAGLTRLGMADRIVERLDALGVACTVYDGVEPNPTFAQVEAGVTAYQQAACEAVLAVGGGSPMDAAKVIAACVSSGKSIYSLVGNFKVTGQIVPLFALPTTAGTGSEVTVAAVLSDHVAHQKRVIADPKLVPAMAALDPEIMLGLPPAVTAATGMDALTHAVESYLSTNANDETDRYALSAVRLIFTHLPRAYQHGEDIEARQAMALAACYAGLAFTRAIVGYVHAIAHQFGALYHTPHGLANAIVMPHVLDTYVESQAERLAQLALAAGLGTQGDDETRLAESFVAGVRALNESFGIPETLDAFKAADVAMIAARALEEAHGHYPVPRFMDREECEVLLRRMVG